MNRYQPSLVVLGEMEIRGDGDFVLASEAEESFLSAKLEGFEECEQLIREWLHLVAKEVEAADAPGEASYLRRLSERLMDGDYRQEILP